MKFLHENFWDIFGPVERWVVEIGSRRLSVVQYHKPDLLATLFSLFDNRPDVYLNRDGDCGCYYLNLGSWLITWGNHPKGWGIRIPFREGGERDEMER